MLRLKRKYKFFESFNFLQIVDISVITTQLDKILTKTIKHNNRELHGLKYEQ